MTDYIVSPEESQEALEMLGKGYDHHIKDESNDKKYFIITPRIVKAFARNPYDLALWDTIKDIAGEGGECYLNTEQLAILSGMSMGKASDSRKYWLKIGFLKGEVRKDPGYPQPVWHLTVPDLWQKNIVWCEEHPKVMDRIDFMVFQKSLHEVKPSPGEEGYAPHEKGYSPHETKKNLKNNQKEENLGISNKIFADLPVTEEDVRQDNLKNQAPRMFEKAFGTGTWPWSSNNVWQRFEKFVCEIYQNDPQAFGKYIIWRAGDGKYTAMNNKQIRTNPQVFMDTGWAEFEKSQNPIEAKHERLPETPLQRIARQEREKAEA